MRYESIKELPKLVKENNWLKEVDSCLLRCSIFNLEDALKRHNKGNAEFPGFFASYSREGKLYMNTNFIGDKIFFTTKELNRIKAQETAKPTEMGNTVIDKPFADAKIDSDMDFDI